MKSARIIIADDHELVRRGLRATISERTGWEVCGEASSGREARWQHDNLPDRR